MSAPVALHPLDQVAWDSALRDHPTGVCAFPSKGLHTEGFRIGFSRTATLRSAPRNMLSVLHHSDEYLTNECALICIVGPFPPSVAGHMDLSYPPRYSVNDGINSDLCSMIYSSVEQVATVAVGYSQGGVARQGRC